MATEIVRETNRPPASTLKWLLGLEDIGGGNLRSARQSDTDFTAQLVAAVLADPALATQLSSLTAATKRRNVPARVSNYSFPYGRPDWYPIAVNGYGPGNVSMSRSVHQLARQASLQSAFTVNDDEAWVSPDYGDDGNDGSRDRPVRTMDYAVGSMTASNVHMLPGVHNPWAYRTDTQTAAIAGIAKFIDAPLGRAVVRQSGTGFPDISAKTWSSSGSGVYEASLSDIFSTSAVQRVVSTLLLDAYGQPSRYKEYASLVALQDAGVVTGWFWDGTGKKLHIKSGGTDIETIKQYFRAYYTVASVESRVFLLGAAFHYINGMSPSGDRDGIVFDGVSLVTQNVTASSSQFYIDGGLVRFGYTHGLAQTGGGVMISSRTIAYANRFDGFNYTPNPSSGSRAYAGEYDVVAIKNGDTDNYGTDLVANLSNKQGSSAHTGASSVRVGGIYRENWGTGIGDGGGTGYSDDFSWMVGVICDKPSASDAPWGIMCISQGVGNRKFWLDSCVTRDTTFGVHQQVDPGATGEIKTYNCQFDSPVDGISSAYDPELPDA